MAIRKTYEVLFDIKVSHKLEVIAKNEEHAVQIVQEMIDEDQLPGNVISDPPEIDIYQVTLAKVENDY